MAYLFFVRRKPMNLHYAIPSAIGVVGSIALLIFPFSRRYRDASRWLRSVFFLTSPIVFSWGALGFYLLFHQHGQRSDLSGPRFWALDHLHSVLSGLGLGFLIALVINPEFWRRPQRGDASVLTSR
jgi:hypothetical protein